MDGWMDDGKDGRNKKIEIKEECLHDHAKQGVCVYVYVCVCVCVSV